ncbi:MAG: Calx-beta domain-containing protein [Candidatus Peregrinibacteria bacterium]
MRSFARTSAILFAGVLMGGTVTAVASVTLGSRLFIDVPAGSFYDAAVGELSELGIIKGYGDGRFGPNDYVTRGQVAVMMKRLRDELKISGVASSSSSSSRSSSSSSSSSSVSSEAAANAAGTIRFTTTNYAAKKTVGTASVTVIRAGGTTGPVTVDYEVTAGTATTSNFEPSTGTLHFIAGQSNAAIPVRVYNTGESIAGKTVNLTLKNPEGGAALGTPVTAVLTISDDGTAGTSGSSSSTATSANAGAIAFGAKAYEIAENAGTLIVTLVRTGGTTGQVTVKYQMANGTAQGGTHYTMVSDVVTFAAGEATKTFAVGVVDNTDINGNKTFTLSLNTPTGGAAIGDPASAVVTIGDDEIGAPTAGALQFSKSTFTALKADKKATVLVNRVGGTVGTVTVNFATVDDSAVAGLDYTAASGTITFLPGESQKMFTVVVSETSTKTDARFAVNLASPTGSATLGTPSSSMVVIQ